MAKRALRATRGGPSRARQRAAIGPKVCYAAALQLWRRCCVQRRHKCVAARSAGAPSPALNGTMHCQRARARRCRPARARFRRKTTAWTVLRRCGGPGSVLALAAAHNWWAHVRVAAQLRVRIRARKALRRAGLQPHGPRAAFSAQRQRLNEALRAKQRRRCSRCLLNAHTPAPRTIADSRGRVHKCAGFAAGLHAGRRGCLARTVERSAFGYKPFWARVSSAARFDDASVAAALVRVQNTRHRASVGSG
jgi:hypothetical protein